MKLNLLKNDTIIILQGVDYFNLYRGDQYSFPLNNDLTISNREGDHFFNQIAKSEENINLFIISEKVNKSTIDYINTKSNDLFTNYKINVFEYDGILFDRIELDIENIVIKDDISKFMFIHGNWIEKDI
jgi:hypothetical protein|tara:strand:+ start:700 stop:1086 length:387 start_codon:yes stop_codon:yes gene_type:complete